MTIILKAAADPVDITRLMAGYSVYAGKCRTRFPSIVDANSATIFAPRDNVEWDAHRTVWLDERYLTTLCGHLPTAVAERVSKWYVDARQLATTLGRTMTRLTGADLLHVRSLDNVIAVGMFRGHVNGNDESIITRDFCPNPRLIELIELIKPYCGFSLGIVPAGYFVHHVETLDKVGEAIPTATDKRDGQGRVIRTMDIAGTYGFMLIPSFADASTMRMCLRPRRQMTVMDMGADVFEVPTDSYHRLLDFKTGRGTLTARIHDDVDHFQLKAAGEAPMTLGNGVSFVLAIATDGDSKLHFFVDPTTGQMPEVGLYIDPKKKQKVFVWEGVHARIYNGQLKIQLGDSNVTKTLAIPTETLLASLSHKWLMHYMGEMYGSSLAPAVAFRAS